MTLFLNIINKIQGISLKWKLLIPFLFFAFSGTSLLTLIGINSQQNIIREEERKEILFHYRHFLESIHERELQSVSLASVIAENPEVQFFLAERNREALFSFLAPTFKKLKHEYNINQLHFHIPPATSFLRLHNPETFGDDLSSYRKLVTNTITNKQATSGIEKGIAGLGIRGVAPVFYQGKIAGSVEIGHSFEKAFLEDFYQSWNVDIGLYDINDPYRYTLSAGAGETQGASPDEIEADVIEGNNITIRVAPEKFPDRSILSSFVKDFSGNNIALIRLSLDRSETRKKIIETRNLMLAIGFLGIILSFALTYLVIIWITKPIKAIVGEARDIALGNRESRLEFRPLDEIGHLTEALNVMLEALKRRRLEVEDYARTLEKRVNERTTELVASEEKYRTLVENVPLVVYRILRDGRTEFVNSYMTDKLGYTVEEAVTDNRFWRDKMSGADINAFHVINEQCFKKGEECRIETKLRAKDGHLLDFITHVIPYKDSTGTVQWIDGISLEITELKKLQEKALQSEEIRTLGEISARMAHEIRNPLSTVGGFARRLNESLGEDDANKKMASIIVDEVAKLEIFLQVLFSSIQPFDLVLSDVDINDLLKTKINELKDLSNNRGIKIIVAAGDDIPTIQADHERLGLALGNIIKHAIVTAPAGDKVFISTREEGGDRIVLQIIHKAAKLTDDDLDKFFFPHIEGVSEWTVQDLPLSKIIIHRHGAILNITRVDSNTLRIQIDFPIMTDEH